MTTRLTLVCHGATAATRQAAFPGDEPLERRAAARAARLAGRLGRATRAWSSPALRARQTAEALGLVTTVEGELRDCDYGRWTGRGLAEVEAEEPEAIAAWSSDPGLAPHGGEALTDLMRRIAAWLEARSKAPGHGIAVTHASIIRAAIVHCLVAPAPSFWRVDIAPLSRTVLSRSSGPWRLQAIEPGGS